MTTDYKFKLKTIIVRIKRLLVTLALFINLMLLTLLPSHSQTLNLINGCDNKSCLINPTEVVISSDSSFFLVLDSSSFPIIKRFDFIEGSFAETDFIKLNIENQSNKKLKLGLSKDNTKAFVYEGSSEDNPGSIQIINLSDKSIKKLESPLVIDPEETKIEEETKQIDGINFINQNGSKALVGISDSNTFELLEVDINSDIVEKRFSIPDAISSISISPNFKKAVISFNSAFSQSVEIYDIEDKILTQQDTKLEDVFKIDDFLITDKFDISGNFTVLSTISGAHALSYLNLKKNSLSIKMIDKNANGKSIATISKDGQTAYVAGEVTSPEKGFKLYKLSIRNDLPIVIQTESFINNESVLNIDTTNDQRKILLLVSREGSKILRVLNAENLSKITEIIISDDTSNNVLAQNTDGNYIVILNPKGTTPINIISDLDTGPVFKSISPNIGSINGGASFTINGFLDLNRFLREGFNICFNNLNTCASSVQISGDGRKFTGAIPKAENIGLTDIILKGKFKESGCSSCSNDTSIYKKLFNYVSEETVNDKLPPKLTITNNTIPLATNKESLILKGVVDGTDSDIDRDTVSINDSTIKTRKLKRSHTVSFIVSLELGAEGTYPAIFKATDVAGNTLEEDISIIVDTEEPEIIAIDGSINSEGTVSLSGTVNGTGSNIDLIKVNGVAIDFTPEEEVEFSVITDKSPVNLVIKDKAGNVNKTTVRIVPRI